MNFICSSNTETWCTVLESIRCYKEHFEFVVMNGDIIHGIIGKSFRGLFACFPDLKKCCLIANLSTERYWNRDVLIKILGKKNGITVEATLFELMIKGYLNDKLTEGGDWIG